MFLCDYSGQDRRETNEQSLFTWRFMNGLPLVSFMNILQNAQSIVLETIKDIKHNKIWESILVKKSLRSHEN